MLKISMYVCMCVFVSNVDHRSVMPANMIVSVKSNEYEQSRNNLKISVKLFSQQKVIRMYEEEASTLSTATNIKLVKKYRCIFAHPNVKLVVYSCIQITFD